MLVPTRFRPSSLPLVLAYNQEVKLKKRLEDDKADERIGKAALWLARQFTRTIDASQEARLYINLNSPIITALLSPERPADAPPVRAAATVLWGMARLMAPAAETDERLEDTLTAIGEHLHILLKSGGES